MIKTSIIDIPTIIGDDAKEFISKADNPVSVEVTEQQIKMYKQSQNKNDRINRLIECVNSLDFIDTLWDEVPIETAIEMEKEVINIRKEMTNIVKDLCVSKDTDVEVKMRNPEIFKAISNGAVIRDVESKVVSNGWFSDLLSDVGNWEICYDYTDSDSDIWILIK